MSLLVDGEWKTGEEYRLGGAAWEPRSEGIRGQIRADGTTTYPSVGGRYHLVGCPGCPMAHRAVILRKLKGLEDVISFSTVRITMGANGREFGTENEIVADPTLKVSYLYEAYLATDSKYSGRASAPVLWDKQEERILSNNTVDILAMFNSEFDEFSTSPELDLLPAKYADAIDLERVRIYDNLVSKVYKAGFSRSQPDYDVHVRELFQYLGSIDESLSKQQYFLGDVMTEVDILIYVSLLRFDACYYNLFKCNLEPLSHYKNLVRLVAEVDQLPGMQDTYSFEAIKQHYFRTHLHINPTGVVPVGPELAYLPSSRMRA